MNTITGIRIISKLNLIFELIHNLQGLRNFTKSNPEQDSLFSQGFFYDKVIIVRDFG